MATYKGIGWDATNITNRQVTTGNNVDFDGSVIVSENLTVQGTTITNETETVLIEDNYLDLNFGYTTASAKQGGFTINYLPTSTTSNVAGAAFSSTSVVNVASGTGFATGNIIQIKSSSNTANNGLYEIQSVATNAITIDTTPTEKFSKSAFVADATVAGNVTKVTVSVLQVDTSGDWQIGKGSAAGITYSAISTAASGTVSLNNISTGGANNSSLRTTSGTITLGDQTGTMAWNGSGAFSTSGFTTVAIDASSGISIDGAGAASNLSSTGQDLTISTISSGTLSATSAAELDLTSAGLLDINAGANLDVDATGTMALDSTDTTNLTMAANAAATKTMTIAATNANGANVSNIDMDADGTVSIDGGVAIDIGKNADKPIDIDSSTLDIDSSGAITIDGALGISIDGSGAASNLTSTGQDLTIETKTSGTLAIDAVAELDLTSAGLLDINAGANLDVDATGTMALDSTDTTNLTMSANVAGNKTLTISSANAGSGDGNLALSAKTKVTNTVGSDSTDLRAGRFDVTSTDRIRLDCVGDSRFAMSQTANTASTLQISANQTGTQAADATLKLFATTNGAGDAIVDIDGSIVQVDATGGVSIDGGGASNFTTGGGTLTLQGAGGVSVVSTGGTLLLNGTGQTVDVNSAAFDLDASGAIAVDGTSTIDIGANAAAGNIGIGTNATQRNITVGTNTGNTAISVNSGSGDISLKAETGSHAFQRKIVLKNTVAQIVGSVMAVENASGTAVALLASAASGAAHYFVGFANDALTGNGSNSFFYTLTNSSYVVVNNVDAGGSNANVAATDIGKRVFLSDAAAGRVSMIAPTATGTVVYQVGVIVGASGSATPTIMIQPQFIATN